jgi:hypothetical protein
VSGIAGKNPFSKLVTDLAGSKAKYYSLVKFGDKRIGQYLKTDSRLNDFLGSNLGATSFMVSQDSVRTIVVCGTTSVITAAILLSNASTSFTSCCGFLI